MSTQAAAPQAAAGVPGTGMMPAPAANTTQRQEFGATSLQRSGETAAVAVAAQAQAMVQARYVMALQRPRDMDEVRVRIMKEVERPGFAEAAWFRKPVGDGVEGLSVRFAEAALRCMGNVSSDAAVVFEDDQQRIVRLCVADLENNVPYTKDIVVAKTVERRFLKKGQEALSVRMNSKGETTYLVQATDDELLAKENALISKALRNAALRLLPGDIQDEARNRIKAIRHGDVAKDPDGARRKIADAFAELGVTPAALKLYLGHDLATCSPAELVDLRSTYTAIKQGDATWSEVLEGRTGEVPEEKKPAGSVTDRLRAAAPQVPGAGSQAPPEPAAPADPALVDALRASLDQREPGADEDPPPPACDHRGLWKRAAEKGTSQGKRLCCDTCPAELYPSEVLAIAREKGGA